MSRNDLAARPAIRGRAAVDEHGVASPCLRRGRAMVDFRFRTPVRLSGFDGAAYQFGLLSGATPNVARYASTRAPAALWWGPDTYADGPNAAFATAADGTAVPSFRDDNEMSIQGIAAPVGPDDFGTCFG